MANANTVPIMDCLATAWVDKGPRRRTDARRGGERSTGAQMSKARVIR